MLGYTKEEKDVFISYNGMIVLFESNDGYDLNGKKLVIVLERTGSPECIEEEIQNFYI